MPLTSVAWYARSNPLAGDLNPGSGISTATETSPQAVAADAGVFQGMTVGAAMQGTAAGHPVTWWFAIIALVIGLKFAAEAAGEENEFHSLRVGILNTVIVTIMAIIGIAFAKWVFGFYKVPGLSTLILSI